MEKLQNIQNNNYLDWRVKPAFFIQIKFAFSTNF